MHNVLEKTSFGFWVYIMSDCVLFAALFATYAVLHGQTFGGATITQLVDLHYVMIETILLLTSSFTAGLAILFASQNKKWPVLTALLITFLLGTGFVGMEVNEFSHLIMEGNGPSQSAFLSSYFTLVGTHGLHVTLGLIWMLTLMIFMVIRGLSPSNIRKLVSLSLFWHFLDIVWIFIFTIVYLFGTLGI